MRKRCSAHSEFLVSGSGRNSSNVLILEIPQAAGVSGAPLSSKPSPSGWGHPHGSDGHLRASDPPRHTRVFWDVSDDRDQTNDSQLRDWARTIGKQTFYFAGVSQWTHISNKRTARIHSTGELGQREADLE